jgi:crossover junction endodeoxyribonuclease RuvC
LRILGIDPGTNVTGYGIVEKHSNGLTKVLYGEIRTVKKQQLSQRLKIIFTDLMAVIEKSEPDTVVLEDIFFGKNVKSLIKQGHARGVVLLAASMKGLPVYEYSPLEIKKAVVGYGRAEKSQVQQMVKAILRLSDLPPEDAADALAIAICHSNFGKTQTV